MSSSRSLTIPSLALTLVVASLSSGCRGPQELDAVAALPRVAPIERASQRPKLSIAVDDSLPEDAVPDDLMAPSIGGRDPRPIDRLRRTFEVALETTDHFEVVPAAEADFHFEFTVRELHAETPDDIGFFEWWSFKFFGRYLMATARLGGALFDSRTGEQIGANYERRGQFRSLEGKAFRGTEDQYLDLLGMGGSFAKTGEPILANAVQKAIVKLIGDIAQGTAEPAASGKARQKDADG